MEVQRTSRSFRSRPPESQYLWHVVNRLEKLITFLRGGLWLARLDTFSDSLEGTAPDPNLGLLSELLPAFQIHQVVEEYVRGVRHAFASCWHMNDGDPSDAVWRSFGKGREGIAIRSTEQKIRNSLGNLIGANGPLHCRKVEYIDHAQDFIADGNTIEAAFVVQTGFMHENEYRVLVYAEGGDATQRLLAAKDYEGRDLLSQTETVALVPRIDSEQFIEEIVLGPDVTTNDRAPIVQLLESFGLKSKLRL